MQVTEVRIRLANEEFVKAYASICFDDRFLVHDIRVIKGHTEDWQPVSVSGKL
jgi:DNA-binding cell septation regulator SpoVG